MSKCQFLLQIDGQTFIGAGPRVYLCTTTQALCSLDLCESLQAIEIDIVGMFVEASRQQYRPSRHACRVRQGLRASPQGSSHKQDLKVTKTVQVGLQVGLGLLGEFMVSNIVTCGAHA